MKKLLLSFLSLVLLAGCSSSTTTASEPTSTPDETIVATEETTSVDYTGLKVLSPSGAPVLSLIGPILDGVDVEVTDGADKLQAELISGEVNYDVIIAPTNLGVKLAANGKTTYKLLDVVTWGNLYVVAEDGVDLDTANIAGFGEQAVTGLVFKALYPELSETVNWGYASVTEAQAALLSGQANAAILAEPVATATIAKAKENGQDLSIIVDLQAEWSDEGGYPQAGLFVDEEAYNADREVYDALVSRMQEYTASAEESVAKDGSELIADIDTIGAENLSVPSSAIIAKVWNRMNIHVTEADTVVDELSAFLTLFDVSDVSAGIISSK